MTPSIYPILAEIVVVLHFLFVVFAVLGGFLVWRWRWVAWLHVPAAIWAVMIEFGGWICPLTPLEVWLRQQAGQGGYEGGFLAHYVTPLLYPEPLTREIQIMLGAALLILNAAIYWRAFRKRR